MGVTGFTSYVVEKDFFFVNLKLRNIRLVVDGNSLYRRLYLSSRFDRQHGGEYDFFADRIRRFFKALFLCDIRPFVVLDGSMDHTENKLRTLQHRAQANINVAHALSTGSRGTNLPVLGKAVFRQVLSGLEVPFVQCIADAEREMVSLANQWNCAVLTMDSIFYIFDLKGGCLPTIYFQWDKVSMCKKKASEWYIDARLFSIDRFCAHFNHMNKELLPLFAAMAMNDYTDLWQMMKTFFAKANIPKRPLQSKDWSHERIDGLLHWLSRFPGPQEALKRVLDVLGDVHSRSDVRSLLSSGMEQYRLSASNLVPFFTEGAPLSNLPDPFRALPAWILQALAKGQLGFFILNVMVSKRVMLHTQVEDFRLPSCNITSQPIRQVLYGLLLDGKQWQKQADRSPDKEAGPMDAGVDSGSPYCVQEFGRQNLELWSSSVPAVLTKTVLYLPLERLNEVWVQIRLEVLLDTLGVKPSVLPLVPSHLSMLVCVTCYWLTHAEPKPDLQHLQALLLGLVYGELKHFPGPTVSRPALGKVRKRLGQLRVQRQRDGPDLRVAHTFSQWQSCLRMSLLLNQLLCFPLPEPECARLYRGTLVHQAVKEMKRGRSPEDLLKGPNLPGQLYRDVLGAVQSSVGADFFKRKRRQRDQRQAQEQQGQQKQQQNHAENGHKTSQDLNSMLAQQECDGDEDDDDNYDDYDGDEDEDDQEDEQQCRGQGDLIRVRFKTKFRTTRAQVRVRVRKPDQGIW